MANAVTEALPPLRLRSQGIDWRQIGGEIVALDVVGSTYFTANASGALIWLSLVDGSTIDELADLMVQSYDIDATAARADVEQFVEELRRLDFLEP